MSLKYFFSGFFVKAIAGFDDSMVRIPIAANITKTKTGRIAFALGTFFAIAVAILFSFLFGSVVKSVPYSNYISAGLIFLLAFSVYGDWFIRKPKKEVEKKLKKIKRISPMRFFKLLGIGFLVAFATIIDDTIAYSALFLGSSSNFPFVIGGIFTATILQLSILVYFSEKFMKIKKKKEITTIGLIILGLLILTGVL
jgi:magnesium-transporting ATPase (P-type)